MEFVFKFYVTYERDYLIIDDVRISIDKISYTKTIKVVVLIKTIIR